MSRFTACGRTLPWIVLGAAGLVLAANLFEFFGIQYLPVGFALNAIAAVIIFACLFYVVRRRAANYRRETVALAVAAVAFAGSLFFQTDVVEAVEGISAPARKAIIDSLAEGGLGITIAALVSLFVASDRRHSELSRAAEIDPLTGLLNRSAFHEAFKAEWSRCVRHKRPLSCALLDIDFFKRVNDEHGHAAGDAALQAFARLLQEQLRPTDYVCRHGGEEFCVLLPETTETEAASWAERIRAAVQATSMDTAGTPVSITTSIGVAEKLDDVASPDRLIALADEALLAAKQAGRNCVLRYATLASTDEQLRESIHRNQPLHDLSAADVMYPLVHCVQTDDTLRDAAHLLLDFRAGSAPVIDETGAAVGMLSEADVLETPAGDWSSPVSKFMKTSVVSYDHQARAQDVLEFLSRVSIRRVVVVRDGRPIGVISRGGLIQWLLNQSMQQSDGAGEAYDNASRLQEIVTTLIERGQTLRSELQQEHEQLIPLVVSEATRIQELTTDLLAQCQAYRGA